MKRYFIYIISVFLALAGVNTALAHGYKVGQLEIGHPYSRAMLPGAKVGGGYLKITNTGTTDDRLVSVSTDRAESSQIHEMQMENGIMSMRELKDGIAIPAGSTVELKPGSYHIMFMNVNQPFKEGEKVRGQLVFEKAGPVDVEFVVGSVGGDAPKGEHADHGHMDHGAMDAHK